jgi:diaminopimelate epimerase
MSGSGNDFVIIDNRTGIFQPHSTAELARTLCRRKVSVGADGLILLENDPEVDFSWQFFNADGSSAEMCGNGGRCAARLAHMLGICGSSLSFRTLAGVVCAQVFGTRVKLQITAPRDMRLDEDLEINGRRLVIDSVNTGVPHAVFIVDSVQDLEGQNVSGLGRTVRFHSHYAPAGTNVNFSTVLGDRSMAIRTYERGVEDETLACGTGATAVALVAAAKHLVNPPVEVHTKSGEVLTIHFDLEKGLPDEVFLEGETRVVYQGELWQETVQFGTA